MNVLERFTGKMSFELDLKEQSRSLTSKKKKKTAGRRKQVYRKESGSDSLAQMVKDPLAMQETQVLSLGWEDPLEKGIATHSSILALRIPWTV